MGDRRQQQPPLVSPVPTSPPPSSVPPQNRYIGSLKRKKNKTSAQNHSYDDTDTGKYIERYCQVGPLAQSVERGADNAKVVSSRLTWTTFFYFFSIFNA